ncbi:MAG: PKD domain-containing protein, partial [Thermoplasmata archaeon]|nr:PKD domain-containing protein [Thermoplasmata archaeon]
VFLTKITGVEDANLTGNIRDSKGNPGKDAHVYLIDTNASHDGANIFGLDDSHVIMTRADTDGDYAFDNAYTGNFSLMARVGSSRYYFGNETDVNLTAGANTRDLVYDDYNDGSTVYVKVFNTTSDNKHKLVDVDEIIIYDDVNNTWNSATTNPVGIRVTDGDNYYLIVRAPGYMTHIEKITVDGYTSISVYLDESAATTRVTNITFTDWENVAFSTTETRQFDDSPAYRNNEWGIFQSGIIRYDADRIFGNGDGTLSSAEANAYETFLNTIGPDGDYTWDKFNVDSKGEDDIGYEYSNYAVTLDAGGSRVNSTSTLQFDYTYDLKAAKEIKAYKVEIKVDHENATVDLPDGYEIVDELSLASHDENDTTIVYVNGTGQGEFECARNVSPTPVIELTDDFIPDDGIYLYRAGEYIEFNASKSHDRGSPYGGIMSYEWTFEGIGTNDTPVAVWKFIEGTYNITLNVTDNAGGFNEANITLIVDSTPPDVNFSVEPDGVNQGPFVEGNTIVYLNITNLTDTNGIHDNVTWDLGDGNVTGITSADDRNITHQYHYLNLSMLTGENEYTYTINLTVRDRAGNENMVSHTVRVNNTRRPTAHFEITNDLVGGDGRYVFNADENITFNATASHGQDMEIINYTWDFGDDTPLAYEEVVNHTYVENEKYNATLTVKDEVGGTTTVNKTIYVDNLEPTVIFEIEGAWLHDGWYYIDQKNNTPNTPEDYLFNLTANGTHDNGPIGNLTGLYNFTWSFGAPDKPPSSAGLVDECLSNVATTYLFSDITRDNKNFTIENVTHYYY